MKIRGTCKPKHITCSHIFNSVSHIPKIICKYPIPKIKTVSIPVSLNRIGQYLVSRNTLLIYYNSNSKRWDLGREEEKSFLHYWESTLGCVTRMINEPGWQSFVERKRTHRLTLLYKIQRGLMDANPGSGLRTSDRRTRGSRRFYQPTATQFVYKYSFMTGTNYQRQWQTAHHYKSAELPFN